MIRWQRTHGRHGLPWQQTRDPYRVWLSEIMLQQTQVATVLGYYTRFLERYGDVRALAAAPLDDVLALWAGLGYYARARNLHACARAVVEQHKGRFPESAGALAELPGIGASTAAAIAAFCFHERAAILDANVQRVLLRRYAIEDDPQRAPVRRLLLEQAQALLPEDGQDMPAFTQGIMDLGATICTTGMPACAECPVAIDCRARILGRAGELPVRRAKAARPLRRAHLLLALHRGAVLLEQRPARGIWGGLYSLPQFARPTELRRAAQALGGDAPRALGPRTHTFTHFQLRFTPHRLALGGSRPKAPFERTRWVPLGRLQDFALPSPIRKLLDELRTSAPRG